MLPQHFRAPALGNPNAAQQARLASKCAIVKANEFAASIAPRIEAIRRSGTTSFLGTAAASNAQGVRTQRGKSWTAAGVSNIFRRAYALDASRKP